MVLVGMEMDGVDERAWYGYGAGGDGEMKPGWGCVLIG